MNKLQNYACGQWAAGSENGQELFNAITGDVVATVSSKGLDVVVNNLLVIDVTLLVNNVHSSNLFKSINFFRC